MTIQPSPYELLRAIQDQQRATDRLVHILLGMLDQSAPDPFLSSGPAPARTPRRLTDTAARPGAVVEIDGIEVHTTQRRANLLASVMAAPQTLDAMARAGVSPTVAGTKAQIRDTNADLERAGVTRRVRMQAIAPQRRGAKGGREPALYALLDPKDTEIVAPGSLPAAQSEAAASESLEQGPDACVGGGDVRHVPTQSGQFVAPAGEGEGVLAPVDPLPAADATLPTPLQQPQPESTPSAALFDAMGIVAIDTHAHIIRGPKGDWQATAPVARTIARMNADGLFGLDVLLKAGPWPGADAFRTRLTGIRAGLSGIGVDLIEVPQIGFRIRLQETA
ncbi:MAG TPA: hypothetical protein VGN82_14365 [Bosea sp. (in: a-proteobacteria)]|jgi:hypothetical protein|uniref:hypothetical protein n=1 Tax=Bosea sp. (in: a-proteobacteria) TaxID=1871050 RepID=UPI002E0E2277|nr:hypothetical protein [Bosea sp. (in: a-proteobacteria)]